jgi:hypothetical protein
VALHSFAALYHYNNITNDNLANNTTDDLNETDPLNYTYSAFQQSFTKIKLKNTTAGEIEKILKR